MECCLFPFVNPMYLTFLRASLLVSVHRNRAYSELAGVLARPKLENIVILKIYLFLSKVTRIDTSIVLLCQFHICTWSRSQHNLLAWSSWCEYQWLYQLPSQFVQSRRKVLLFCCHTGPFYHLSWRFSMCTFCLGLYPHPEVWWQLCHPLCFRHVLQEQTLQRMMILLD